MNNNASIPTINLAQLYQDISRARLTRNVIDAALKTATPDQINFLAHLLREEAISRDNSTRKRLLASAHLPAIKTFDTYDWSNITFPNDFNQESLTHLDFIHNNEDLVLYGDVGCGKTHLATAIVHKACMEGIRARFTTAAGLVTSLRQAKQQGRLDNELNNLAKNTILVIDELGYIPIDPEGAHLLFQVINNSYEASSLVITTNIEFSRWGTIFADDTIAAAIIDRVIHYGRLLRFKGQSWRLTHALMH